MGDIYSDTILADTPQGYYLLNETSGTVAADSSGNGNTGTIAASGIAYAVPGCLLFEGDRAMAFTTTSGQVALPAALNANGYSGLTVECWVILTTNGPGNGLFYNIGWGPNNSGAHQGYLLYMAGGAGTSNLNLQVNNGATNVIASAPNNLMVAWTVYHLVGTFDGSNIRLYINGVLKATVAQTGPISNAGNPSITRGTTSFFPGTIDRYAIYNYALSQAKITAHYLAGLGAILITDLVTIQDASSVVQILTVVPNIVLRLRNGTGVLRTRNGTIVLREREV